jgi:hypothetical protein
MTDWCGAANMTVEEFKQALKDLNDKTVNIYGDRGRQRSRQDRTYASQTEAGLQGQPLVQSCGKTRVVSNSNPCTWPSFSRKDRHLQRWRSLPVL